MGRLRLPTTTPNLRKEATMHYKTIALELLEQYPELYERLRRSRILLTILDLCATELASRHLAWERQIAHQKPGSHPNQVASEALELAVEQLRDRLASVSPPDETGSLTLDDTMAFLREHIPSA
jgi:hypothetical protein